MDSGNSGSLQSSSGGDEEFDSRTDSFSAFMSKHGGGVQISHLSQPPQSAAMFSPLLSSYIDPGLQNMFSDQNSMPLLNLDMAWSKALRSDPCSPQISPILPPTTQKMLSGGFNAQSSSAAGLLFPSTVAEGHGGGSGSGSGTAAAASEKEHSSRVMRNPKKRSRASRRAPTTVLTTDTSNFRAMVQEFTGIPAPPFTPSSPFPRTRFDLFGAPRSGVGYYPTNSQPPYLRRPFPQKVQPPPPPPPSFLAPPPPQSGLVDTLASSSGNSLFTIQQNNILSSLLHQSSSPKYPRDSLEIPKLGGVLDEFGSVTGLPSLISPDQTGSRTTEPGPVCWGGPDDGVRPAANDDQVLQSITNNVNGFSSSAASHLNGETNGNLNFPTAASNFNGEKSTENVTRGEGMTESWICSSELK